MKLKVVRGTRDLFGDEVARFQFLEQTAQTIFKKYGFQEIRTPLIERTELFTHGVGEDTDIVGKEMYLLEKKTEGSTALRPEGTASVVRSIVQNNMMGQNNIVKLYYSGPMFRYERPQKGRYRQFHQIGVEAFGGDTPDVDLEMLLMLQHYLEEIKLTNISFQLNSIGCQAEECRPTFKTKLISFLEGHKEELCEDCQRRMVTNPLRVLDCKVATCVEITEKAPKIYEEICSDCEDHFSSLQDLLSAHDVKYELNPRLVRGLDYYSRTVFEIYSDELGAQGAAGGGGRYDSLFVKYGQKAVPAIGFALGTDRLAMLLETPKVEEQVVFVVGNDMLEVSKVVSDIRRSGYTALYDSRRGSMKSQFRQANKVNAKLVVVLGENEIKNQEVAIKDMEESSQTIVARDSFIQSIQSMLSE